MMEIQNFDQLAATPLRKRTLLIVEAGLEAAQTRTVMHDRISLEHNKTVLRIRDRKFPLSLYKRILVVGVGRGSVEAATKLHEILGDRIAGGYVIDVVPSGNIGNIVCKEGTDNRPSVANVAITHDLMGMLKLATADDLIISITSAGAEHLLCAPSHVTVEQERAIAEALVAAGSSADEITCVQNHMSLVNGGQLAKLAYPATMVTLFFNDTELKAGMLASGPTVFNKTTVHDASEILHKYGVLHKLGMDSLQLIETPKEKKYFEFSHNIGLVSPQDAIFAMVNKAHDFGFRPKVIASSLFPNAARHGNLAKVFASIRSEECVIAAGTNATNDRDMYNAQDTVLASLRDIPGDAVIAALNTNITEHAGAIADSALAKQSAKQGVDFKEMLAQKQSEHFFAEIGAAIQTQTTANIGNLLVFLKQ